MNNPSPILLVDADEVGRHSLAGLLRECGYAVLDAPDGWEGIKHVGAGNPALLIVDPWPDTAGATQLLQSIGTLDSSSPLPVLILSSIPSGGLDGGSTRAGAQKFLQKPVALPYLLTVIEGALRGTSTGSAD